MILGIHCNVHLYPALGRVFNGVFYQVVDYLAQVIAVDVGIEHRAHNGSTGHRFTTIWPVDELEALGGCFALQPAHNIAHKGHYVHYHGLALQAAIIGLGDV